MARVKLQEKEFYPFSCTMKVRIYDINQANHVGNVELTALIHEARHQFFASMKLNELNIGDDKTSILLGDLVINFVAEAFIDNELDFHVAIDEISSRGFRIFYRVSRDDVTIALAETGSVAYNYHERKISPVPAQFIEILKEYNYA